MNEIQLHRLDLNLLVVFEALMDERSVTAAADKLGKTPSAISHALGRLRDQLNDPIMVKVGGKMNPSPFALRLIDDVRPILRLVKRAVSPPADFDPSTAERTFRVEIGTFQPLMRRVYGRINAEAPTVVLEWSGPREGALTRLAEGLVDLVMFGNSAAAPEGVTKKTLPPSRLKTFARSDHPAIRNWSLEEWQRWPHIMVDLGSRRTTNTADQRIEELGRTRRIGARVPDFGALPPLLAETDFLANSFYVCLGDMIDLYDLAILETPLGDVDTYTAVYWNTGLARDPGLTWLRNLVTECYVELVGEMSRTYGGRDIPLTRA